MLQMTSEFTRSCPVHSTDLTSTSLLNLDYFTTVYSMYEYALYIKILFSHLCRPVKKEYRLYIG